MLGGLLAEVELCHQMLHRFCKLGLKLLLLQLLRQLVVLR